MTSKDKKVTIRFSGEQYDELTTQAKANGMDLANYIRERVFFDAPQIEQNSFEFKMLKSVSYCVGAIRGMVDLKLSKADKKVVSDEVSRIMNYNGIKVPNTKTKSD